ncbi:MAG: UDP-glucose/GDP-mannose dehydrogenase family protein [Patescibacteria group bacterium]|nr:UDP-glucose/GDP-mannose dehydrogenase family protein [Patescibacteria group bacterium]
MNHKPQTVCIIGSGYVGLVTGACLAEVGHQVVCVDKNPDKIKKLKKGIMPIYEPGLSKIVQSGVKAGRLSFTSILGPAVKKARAVFIAVGTPSSRRGDGYADLSYVYQVAREIAPYLNKYKVIVDKSTVPVGTADQVSRVIKEKNSRARFDVASNPEFLREGQAVNDFLKPDRVVIGVNSKKAQSILKDIYSFVYAREKPVFITSVKTAELIKYASNAFLATKISFINELAALAEKIGANIEHVSKGMGLDRRIGQKFLKVGPGYGGSCFPKDVTALLRIAQENEVPLRILEATSEVNIAQKARMIRKILQALKNENNRSNSPKPDAQKTVLFLGLTFKPDTDDMRDASSLTIIPALTERGINVRAHDPKGVKEAKKLLPPEVKYPADIYQGAKNVDAVVLLTHWKEYQNLDLKKLKKRMKGSTLVDLRNIFNPREAKQLGFKYYSLGR